jgi:hypothetical protein
MKISVLPIIAITLVASSFAPDAAVARGLPRAKPTPVPEKSKAYAEIKSVSGEAVTIEHSKTTTTYKMNRDTAVTIDDQRARGTDLKPGMHAEVTPSSINPDLLLSISAHSVPKT